MQIEQQSPLSRRSIDQTPGSQNTGSTGQTNNQNTDTLSSYGCCEMPCNLVKGIFNFIIGTLASIKDWISSFICSSTPARTPLAGSPEHMFRDQATLPWSKLQNFYQMLREVTNENGVLIWFQPPGMSDAEMQREIIALYNTDLPEELKTAIDYEFAQSLTPFRTPEGFPRHGHHSFVECLAQEPIKAKAVVLDVMRCQPSYYTNFAIDDILTNGSPLDRLKFFQAMLEKCKMDSGAVVESLPVKEFSQKVLYIYFNVLNRECKEEVIGKDPRMQGKNFKTDMYNLFQADQPATAEQINTMISLCDTVLAIVNDAVAEQEERIRQMQARTQVPV